VSERDRPQRELTGAALRIDVNGKRREVERGRTVRGLLEDLGLDPRVVVVERNREVLRRDALGETEILDGDSLEIVHFVGGG
jgi:thiamine biosynthesis protein ThiS